MGKEGGPGRRTNNFSMSCSWGPQGNDLQVNRLGLLLVTMRENVHHRKMLGAGVVVEVYRT